MPLHPRSRVQLCAKSTHTSIQLQSELRHSLRKEVNWPEKPS